MDFEWTREQLKLRAKVVDFAQRECCGQCVPCRLGTKQMFEVVKDITEGRGDLEDIELLLELAEGVKLGSLCGLGQTAPNPLLSTIRYFRDEYVTHVRDKKCPACVCRWLASLSMRKSSCLSRVLPDESNRSEAKPR